MNICMIGAGSLGSAIGGTLAMGGHEVTFVDPYQAHIDAIQSDGLLITDSPEKRGVGVQVKASTDCLGLSPQDLVIVLVKSFATKSAVKAAKDSRVIGPDTLVLTIQNGMGNEEAIISVLGEENVISGKTFVSGQLLEPGRVVAAVEGRKTIIGEMGGERTARIEELAMAFTHAGLETEASENIRGMIWDKLFVNVATGAVSGVTGLSYGGLYEQYGQNPVPEVKAIAIAAVEEAIAVAEASGVAISQRDPENIWLSAAEGQPEGFKASILQSLERKMASEIDFINGAVSRQGRAVGVPTPVNDTLTACIKGIEYRMGLCT